MSKGDTHEFPIVTETTRQSPTQESTPMKMTREQAIEIDYKISRTTDDWAKKSDSAVRTASTAFIDSLVALGLLQLSEPEPDKIEKLLQHIGANRTSATFKSALDYFGLKIVEK